MTDRIKTLEDITHPDFIWGALDNVHDAETTLDDYAAAVSRAQRAALAASQPAPDAAVTVKPLGWWCDPCRSVGMMHCSDPENCGFMRTASAQADDWKSWLDDLPLPDDFSQGIDRLQDFITRIIAALDVQPITVQDAARVVLISSDRGVCVGGRWDGWLMIRHHDGHWVSHQKLDAVDLRTEMTDALRAIAEGRA